MKYLQFQVTYSALLVICPAIDSRSTDRFQFNCHPVVYNLIPLGRSPEIMIESLLEESEDRKRLVEDIWDAQGIAAAAIRILILLYQ